MSGWRSGALLDLCREALAGRLDPVAGRSREIARVACILGRRTKRNPVLVGPPGVGKSAIAEGFAWQLASGEVPPSLQGARLYSLNLGALLAGTSCRGDFEARLQWLAETVCSGRGRTILFIDEVHLLLRAGRSEGGVDAAGYLKPLLARGAFCCLGASTPAEWGEVCREDPALARRFLPVAVDEPAPAVALEMLRLLRPGLERHHGLRIGDDALEACLSPSMDMGGLLPDRALDLLDETCARFRMELSRRKVPAKEPEALLKARRGFDLKAYAALRLRCSGQSSCESSPLLGAEEVLRGREPVQA